MRLLALSLDYEKTYLKMSLTSHYNGSDAVDRLTGCTLFDFAHNGWA